MSVAKVTEISASSTESFEDAVKTGISRAAKTLNNIQGAWVKEFNIDVEDNSITRFRVDMKVTFILED